MRIAAYRGSKLCSKLTVAGKLSTLARVPVDDTHGTPTAGTALSLPAQPAKLTKVTRPNEGNAPLRSSVYYIGPASVTSARNAMETNTPLLQGSCTRPAQPTLRRFFNALRPASPSLTEPASGDGDGAAQQPKRKRDVCPAPACFISADRQTAPSKTAPTNPGLLDLHLTAGSAALLLQHSTAGCEDSTATALRFSCEMLLSSHLRHPHRPGHSSNPGSAALLLSTTQHSWLR